MYTIDYRRDIDLLDITWSGIFTAEEMSQYSKDCYAIWQKEGFRSGYRLRVVIDGSTPLPQDSLGLLGSAFDHFPVAGRIAMVTSSTICRIQIKRAMMVPNMQIFDEPGAAMEWLLRADGPS